jgi:succinoglycan biosynthesis protein ExoM
MEFPNFHQHKNDSQEINGESICSVCIATYQRPELLKNLLVSLGRQSLPYNTEMEIIVVDNDDRKSAEPTFKEFQKEFSVPCHYFIQPEKNISLTRNMAVKNASGDYILFIDDDEVASPQWIYHLLKTLKEYEADGVFGPVMPEFNETTPEWMKESSLFYNPVIGTGIEAKHRWTSNCMVSASLLKCMVEPFDVRYGITGGEDAHLFDRLECQGARFVYCKEAWVSEFLPPNRTHMSYLLIRAMKGGNTHTRRVIEFAGKKHMVIRVFMVIKALIYGTISLALMILHLPSALRRTKWLLKFASNIGRFSAACGWIYKAYR